MLALPLNLPTATYGGHLGQLLYSVLILLGSTPSGNRRMSSHRTTSGSCCVCALAERAYRILQYQHTRARFSAVGRARGARRAPAGSTISLGFQQEPRWVGPGCGQSPSMPRAPRRLPCPSMSTKSCNRSGPPHFSVGAASCDAVISQTPLAAPTGDCATSLASRMARCWTLADRTAFPTRAV